jgi:hypothetical protein
MHNDANAPPYTLGDAIPLLWKYGPISFGNMVSGAVVSWSAPGAVPQAVRIDRRSYRKTVQNLPLAFLFNGVGVPAAITRLIHTVWAMPAMLASVTAVLVNSFAGRPFPQAGVEEPGHAHRLESSS